MIEENRDLVEKRPDLTLQYMERLCRMGRFDETLQLLKEGRFYSYEGGEGQVPALHAFTHIQLGLKALKKGDGQEALNHFLEAYEASEGEKNA